MTEEEGAAATSVPLVTSGNTSSDVPVTFWKMHTNGKK